VNDSTNNPINNPIDDPIEDPAPFSLSTSIWSEKGHCDAVAVFLLFLSFPQA
jgi:hypothetical protein